MVELTLLERIKVTLSLVISSPLFLVLLLGIALMLVDIYFISKKSKKTKIIYLIVSLIIVMLLSRNYLEPLLSVLDTIGKNIITIIYFPSVFEYVLILLISLIILLISSFSKKTNKHIKAINLIVSIINFFIFFLILDELSKNKVDLTNKVSIYSNEVLMSLFELSVIIFALWIIGLIIYKIINKLIHKNDTNVNFYEEPVLPKSIEELRKEILTPPPSVEYIVVEKKNDNDMFTLDEYRQMKKLLEYIKENQKKDQ